MLPLCDHSWRSMELLPEKRKLEALYRDKNTPREKRSAVRKQINAITAKQDSIQSLMYKAEIDIMQTAPGRRYLAYAFGPVGNGFAYTKEFPV